LSIACFPDNSITIENRSLGYDHARFSLCPLLNPSVSEGAQAAFVFAEEIPIPESPSAPMRSAAAVASCDVLQWLQIPNFDA
jgi:hypothetical protein